MIQQLSLTQKETTLFESVGLFHQPEGVLFQKILAGELHSLNIFGNELFFNEGKRISEEEFYAEIPNHLDGMSSEEREQCESLVKSYESNKNKASTCTVILMSYRSCFDCNPSSFTSRYYVYGTIASVGSIYFDWYENVLSVEGTISFGNVTYVCSDGNRSGDRPASITIKFGEKKEVRTYIWC